MMKENITYMYTIVQIFYFRSIYLVLELWKTDIHVKQVIKWGDGDGFLIFLNQIIFLFLHVQPTCESFNSPKEIFPSFLKLVVIIKRVMNVHY